MKKQIAKILLILIIFSLIITNYHVEADTISGDDTTTTGSTDVEWTDFSNAKFELSKDDVSSAVLKISGATYNNESSYYLYISSDANKIDIENISTDERTSLLYKSATQEFVTFDDYVASKIELNQKLYACIIEYNSRKYNLDIYGVELTRFEEDKDYNGFYATMVTNTSTQIIPTFTHGRENDRKIEVKIGKVTDTSILKKIKNSDTSCFTNLLNYAKKDSGIYDETLDAVSDEASISYIGGDISKTGAPIVNLTGLENGEYYYLYVKSDSENGKYVSNEAVTLTQANTSNSSGYWSLFFYNSTSFSWDNLNDSTNTTTNTANTTTNNVSNTTKNTTKTTNNTIDNTTSPVSLPNTGVKYILIISMVIIVSCTIAAIIKYKKYNY